MNEDGSLGIPHGASQEEETPIAEPNFSSNQEDTEISSTDASAVDDTAISHDSPIEAPIATESDEEPVDIFASPEEQAAEAESASTPGEAPTAITSGSSNSHSITNNPFHNRNRFQANTNTTNSNIPQFFSDSMVASTPISQPRQSKKGLIIGVAIGGIALIVIVVLCISIFGKNGPLGGGNTNNPEIVKEEASSGLKTAYTRYLNILFDNNDSTSDIDYEKAYEEHGGLYANTLLDDPLSEEDNSAYFKKLNTAYESFWTIYQKDFEKDTTPTLINDYYYSRAIMGNLSENQLTEYYIQNGSTATSDYVKKRFATTSTNENLKKYSEKTIAAGSNIIEMLDKAKAKGCIKNSSLSANCFKGNEIETPLKTMENNRQEAYKAQLRMKEDAEKALKVVTAKVLGKKEG